MEGFIIWGWDLILPGCDGTSTPPEGKLPPRAPRPPIGRGRAKGPEGGSRPIELGLGKRLVEVSCLSHCYFICLPLSVVSAVNRTRLEGSGYSKHDIIS